MRTRNTDNPKSPPAPKRTPPARKSATKNPPKPPNASKQSPSEPTVTPKRGSVSRGKTVATNDATATTPETPVEAKNTHNDTVKVSPGTKSGTKRTVKKVVRRTFIRKKPKSSDVKIQTDSVAVEKDDTELPLDKEILEDVKDIEHENHQESSQSDIKNSVIKEEPIDDVCLPLKENEDTMKDVIDVANSINHQEPEVIKKENMETNEAIDDKCLNIQEPEEEEEEEEEDPEEDPEEEPYIEQQEIKVEIEKDIEIEEEPMECYDDEGDNDMDNSLNDEIKQEEDPEERVCLSDEEKDNEIDNDEDEKEVQQEEEEEDGELGLKEEEEECKVAVEERKRRKEFEIFVGGLDRDATEEEVKKCFQYVGEVVDIRMHKEVSSNRNRGFAFVRFAEKEHVARALSEMKNPVIHGKRCGTAPSEDNDTLFLGNICNTWTKEAIRQKLKDYGVERLERITLIPNSKRPGLSRGFAFLEFSGHVDAMLAYKRLQKPDIIFGHLERSVKVAFAEALRELDPESLANVKSVFIDGLPPHWDEDIVREHLNKYGVIEKIMLARNMSSAKRRDFGFIDFGTHEAALACIDGLNNKELGDEKIKVKARLSNPSPKTQAVKGELAGGFRITHGGGPTYPRPGRGFGRGAYGNNHMEFQRGGRGFYQHGQGQYGQSSRMGFAEDYPPAGPHPPFRVRHHFGRGGRWNDNLRGPHQPFEGPHIPFSPRYDHHHDGPHIPIHDYPIMPMRGQPPFLYEEEFHNNRPPYNNGTRHYEDPYMYRDTSRGLKRPYYPEHDPEYMEPIRGRPRFDYSAPGSHLRGGGSGMHSRDYYNHYDYEGPYSSYYGGDRPYGGRYHY